MVTIKIGGAHLDYRPSGVGSTWEILDIHVPNEMRRQGVGRQLLENLFNILGKNCRVYAITRTSNEIAQQFYESCGFDTAGVLRRFYGSENGADAVMYVRSSGGPI